MATLLRVNGTRETIDGPLDLATLHRLVGGYIEIVRLNGTLQRMHVLIVNEDGKRLELVPNAQATRLYRDATAIADVIVGDAIEAVVVNGGQPDERVE